MKGLTLSEGTILLKDAKYVIRDASRIETNLSIEIRGARAQRSAQNMTSSTTALFTPGNSKGMAHDLIGFALTVTVARARSYLCIFLMRSSP